MATRYPPEWIEELRGRADIVSIVSEYVSLKPKGRSFWGLCPFHGEKTASFKVDPDQGLYYCFGCKAGGSVIQFVMEIERMDFSEAIKYLADKVRMPLPAQQVNAAEVERSRSQREKILELNKRAAHFFYEYLYGPQGAAVLSYLHGRGLDDPAIRAFGLGASPSGWDTLTKALLQEGATEDELVMAGLTVRKDKNRFDMFRNRAMFPIINAHGHVLGFGGRAMGDAQPKYLNTADTPAFNKRHNVYAANLLKKTRGLTRVLLVEGYMDVVSLVRHGIQGVAATLGTSLTPEQGKLLKRYAPEIWIAYDGDKAGQTATLRALDVLHASDIPARVLVIPDGKDPDDFIRQHGRESFEVLRPLTAPLYRMQRAKEGLDLSTEDGRTRYAMASATILRNVTQPVELENLIKRLMVETGYPREVLIQQIGISVPERPTYVAPVPKAAKKGAQASVFAEETMAERTLLALMQGQLVPDLNITSGEFTDAVHRQIAQSILEGKSAAEMIETCEDDAVRSTMLEVFSNEMPLAQEAMQVALDCRKRMRVAAIDKEIAQVMENLKLIDNPEEKKAALAKAKQLTAERSGLA